MPGHSSFRADIEALRAIAVTLVVTAHADLGLFSGGFIGVDVFFVVSGFVITRLLIEEHNKTGTIDILAFYGRRARRLLPAFFVVLLFVLLSIRILYPPLSQIPLLQSAASAAIYISNFHFAWGTQDYWGPDTKQDPLLHTWSLGVEEQFYLVWPIVFVIISTRAASNLAIGKVIFALALVASLRLSIYWTSTLPIDAFYLPFSRAWELCIGAFLADMERFQHNHRTTSRWLPPSLVSASGIVLILGTSMTYQSSTPFPGLAALVPVLGAALVIFACSMGPTSPGILRAKAFQMLGRLSYGWYLWHWPVLTIGKALMPAPSAATRIGLVGIALLLAYLSYRFIERPVQNAEFWKKKTHAFLLLGTFPLVFLTASIFLSELAKNASNSPEFTRFIEIRASSPSIFRDGCDHWINDAEVIKCAAGDAGGDQLLILFGDSHAGQWYSAIDQIAKELDWKVMVIIKSACPMVNAQYHYSKIGRTFTECDQWRAAALNEITTLRPAVVLVSSSENYPFSRNEWQDGIDSFLNALASTGSKVAILRDTPRPNFDPPSCLERRIWQPLIRSGHCIFETKEALSGQIDALHKEVAKRHENVRYLDMTPYICSGVLCDTIDGNVIKYRDNNHLSDAYVRTLKPYLKHMMIVQQVLGY